MAYFIPVAIGRIFEWTTVSSIVVDKVRLQIDYFISSGPPTRHKVISHHVHIRTLNLSKCLFIVEMRADPVNHKQDFGGVEARHGRQFLKKGVDGTFGL